MSRGSPRWKAGAPQKSWEQLLRESSLFYGHAYQAAVAGEYAHVQLKNPNNSDIGAAIKYVDINVDSSTLIVVAPYDVDFTTLIGLGYNRNTQGAGSNLQLRSESKVAVQTTDLTYLYCEGGKSVRWKDSLIWLREGSGLMLASEIANNSIRVIFCWGEYEDY